jgi:hypothetical protein
MTGNYFKCWTIELEVVEMHAEMHIDFYLVRSTRRIPFLVTSLLTVYRILQRSLHTTSTFTSKAILSYTPTNLGRRRQ